MSNLELATLIDKVSKNRHHLKTIKDNDLKVLIETIIKTKTSRPIIKELTR